MDLHLGGRRAVVTGGSKGLGAEIARELLREGAQVAICARHRDELEATARELRAGGGKVVAKVADMTRSADVEQFFAECVAELGGLDILVNNAGRAHPGTFATLTDQDFQEDLEVKLFSQIRCSRAALPHLRRAGGGAIININAIYGRQPDPNFFATTVDRAACLAFTKALAMEVAKDRVLVNSVNIGFVRTPQWENIHQRRAPEVSREEFLRQTASSEVPLGRFGEPEEVSGLVAFLASARASYITGASIDVSGGMGRYI
ncbi:MAG TPA: SDR family oxidoreductase [Candidatus Saccharimonadales bacterium]|nr:SDR family oxidoreductase [Candidatus Saccharimonadales bacterium]